MRKSRPAAWSTERTANVAFFQPRLLSLVKIGWKAACDRGGGQAETGCCDVMKHALLPVFIVSVYYLVWIYRTMGYLSQSEVKTSRPRSAFVVLGLQKCPAVSSTSEHPRNCLWPCNNLFDSCDFGWNCFINMNPLSNLKRGNWRRQSQKNILQALSLPF